MHGGRLRVVRITPRLSILLANCLIYLLYQERCGQSPSHFQWTVLVLELFCFCFIVFNSFFSQFRIPSSSCSRSLCFEVLKYSLTSSVQFPSCSVLYSFGEPRVVCGTHLPLLAPRGSRGCFRSECCTGGESVAAPRMNCSLHPPINANHEA